MPGVPLNHRSQPPPLPMPVIGYLDPWAVTDRPRRGFFASLGLLLVGFLASAAACLVVATFVYWPPPVDSEILRRLVCPAISVAVFAGWVWATQHLTRRVKSAAFEIGVVGGTTVFGVALVVLILQRVV